jgi:exosortase
VAGGWLLLLAPLLILYAYGRAFGLLGTETGALYATLVLLGFYYLGPTSMRRMWFAVLYLGFLVTPPYGLVAELTQPLKIGISGLVVDLLYALGYPIARSGVLIQVGQYELLVQQACAGLASLVTLLAMGLLYVHLTRPEGRTHAVLLLLAIVPIALLANFLRVTLLVLLTYHVGDAFAQSAAHDAAGLITFSFGMLGMIGLDRFLDRVLGQEPAHDR